MFASMCKRGKGADSPNVEITPEMTDAGFWALMSYDAETESGVEAAERIYRAMELARRCGETPEPKEISRNEIDSGR